MTFNQFMATLRARWVSFTAVLALTVTTTLVVSMLLPKSYTSSSSVVLDVRATDPISGLPSAVTALTPAYIGTQIDIIQSERVTNKVIAALKLNQNEQLRTDWNQTYQGKGSFDAWLAELIAKNLSVKPSKESNVVSIAYTAVDPGFATALANAYAQAYIDTVLELRVEPAKRFGLLFEDQAKQRRAALEQAQAALSEFQKTSGLTATDERIDIETARLNELSTQLVALQTATADSTSRQVATRGANSDKMQEVLNNPVVGSLKSDLARSEAKLKELLARVGDAHPQVIEARANINELRARLDTEVARVSTSVSVNNSVNLGREAQIRAALDLQRQRVLKLKEQRDQLNILAKDVDNAQRAYDAVLAKLNQTSLESQANQTNVSVIQRAYPSMNPTHPKIALNGALSVILGLVFGTLVALAVEMSDRRLRSMDDITDAMSAPILAVIPGINQQGKPQHAATKLNAATDNSRSSLLGHSS